MHKLVAQLFFDILGAVKKPNQFRFSPFQLFLASCKMEETTKQIGVGK